MRYALIDLNGVVENILECDATFTSPDGYTMVQSDTTNIGATYVGDVFSDQPVAPSAAQLLASAQATQIATLSAACAAAITAGFTSSALGTVHTYPAKQTDQQNLSASVLASLYPGLAAGWTTPFWCADSTGAWAFVNHTAAQIQQAGADGKAAILANMAKNAAFAAQVNAAKTIAAVQAVVWS